MKKESSPVEHEQIDLRVHLAWYANTGWGGPGGKHLPKEINSYLDFQCIAEIPAIGKVMPYMINQYERGVIFLRNGNGEFICQPWRQYQKQQENDPYYKSIMDTYISWPD